MLALTAVGLLLLGGITYIEQRSFELDRIDLQARTAGPAVAGALAQRGIGGEGGGGRRPRVRASARRAAGAAACAGQRACRPGPSGSVATPTGPSPASQVFDYDQDITADPALPADMPLGRVFTAHGKGADDNSYRVYADRNRRGQVVVVAVPLSGTHQRLNRLLLVESLVIGAVLLVLGLVAWLVVRVGLLPLDRMSHTAGAIAGGDLSHRVTSTDPRSEVGRLGIALNAMLDRLEQAFTQRQASEDRLRRFLADASHELRTPARLDPWLRGAVPHGRRARAGRGREGDAPDRGRGRTHGHPGRGPPDRSRGSTRSPRRRTPRSTWPPWPATRSTTRAPRRLTATSRSRAVMTSAAL